MQDLLYQPVQRLLFAVLTDEKDVILAGDFNLGPDSEGEGSKKSDSLC